MGMNQPGSKSNRQKGGYEQYMKGSQGGDYQQYMKTYSQGSAQSGNYQQYLEQYGGDYQKHMQQGGDVKDSSALNLVAEKQSTGSAEGANYQQYMQQYAAEYQKYMQKGGGDYQKYMQQGDANNATELTSDDFKQLYAGKWEPLHENMTQEEALHQYA